MLYILHNILKEVFLISFLLKKFIYIIILFSFFISVFFIPIIQCGDFSFSNSSNKEFIDFNPDGFVWPIPGYTSISSPFGKRNAPTSGASSFHYGTDIPAPEGTKLIAIADGQITFCSFLGAGGYTITLSFDNFKVSSLVPSYNSRQSQQIGATTRLSSSSTVLGLMENIKTL